MLRITPAGERYDVVVGGPGEVMEDNGLELAFRDLRRRRVPPRPAGTQPGRGGTPAARTTSQPVDQGSTSPSSPAPSQQDEWL